MRSQLILQPFRCSAHSPTFPSLHLRHSSFSNPSVSLPTSQFILQPFRCFTYVTAHSPTLPLLHLRCSSFSNPSFASPTSLFILQPFRRFSYVSGSPPGEPPKAKAVRRMDRPKDCFDPGRWRVGNLSSHLRVSTDSGTHSAFCKISISLYYNFVYELINIEREV